MACEPSTPGGAATQFAYDATGRLAGVIDPAGDAAIYRYDAIGNVLSIHRYASSAVGVMSVVPASAPAGASVRVFGTGFSSTPANNTVTFGSSAATVTTATATTLDVTVPAGGSGTVKVTVAAKATTWSGTFRLLGAAPTISGLSASSAASGASVTISGAAFDPDRMRDAVWIGPLQAPVTAASTGSLTVTVPPGTAAGPVKVTTATGTTTGPSFFTIPASVSPTGLCTQTGTVGSPVTPSCANNLVSIPLEASQVYSVSCPGASTPLTMYNPDGTTTVIACQTSTQYFQPGWSNGGQASLPSGGATSVANCTGTSGCTPPSDQKVTNNALLLCDCVVALLRWVGDQIANAAGFPCSGCDPVDLSSGNLVDSHTDLALSDQLGGVSLTRYYSTSLQATGSAPPVGPFGTSGTDSYDITISGSCAQNQPMYLNLPGAGRIEFDRPADQYGCIDLSFLSTEYDQLVATKASAPWFGSTLTWEGARDHAVLRRPDGQQLWFAGNGQITKMVDRFGNTTSFVYNQRFGVGGGPKYTGVPARALAAVIDPAGRWVQMDYTAACLADASKIECPIQSASDSSGRSVTYGYDAQQRLTSVHDSMNREWDFHYDDAANPYFRTSETVPNETETPGGATMFSVTYLNHKVATQQVIGPNGAAHPENWAFAYSTVGANHQTTVTYPSGVTETDTFNADGFLITRDSAPGTAAHDTLQIQRATGTNLVQQETDSDASGTVRRTLVNHYNHDGATWSFGSASAPDDATVYKQDVTTADGSSASRSIALGTTAATWNYGLPSAQTDPGPATTSFGYTAGKLTSVTSPDNISATLGYTPTGLLNAVNAGSRHTSVTYDHGLPATETDALGNTTTLTYDAAGRTTVSAAPPAVAGGFGAETLATYNPDNTAAQTIDAAGGTTTYDWTRWGIDHLVDPNGGHTDAQIAPGGFVTQVTDPYGNSGSTTYLDDGRVATTTSPGGHLTGFTYDNTGAHPTARLTQIGFGRTGAAAPYSYESTLAYGYDASGRVNAVADSTPGAGAVGDTFDDLGRLTKETSPAGTISYGYEPASGFLHTTTVSGGPTTSYAWSTGGHLSTVSDTVSTATYHYDPTYGELSSVDSPGGVTQTITPDPNGNAHQVTTTGLSTGTKTGTYSYTPTGNLETAAGTDNPWLVPAGQDGATYPALPRGGTGSRPSKLNGNATVYNNDGQLSTDGVDNYNWNARGQLTSVTKVADSSTVATMTYGPLGRRRSLTAGTAATKYLFAGGSIAQEQSATGAPTATNLLTPGGKTLTRTPSGAGALTVLAAPFGSAHTLTNNSGTVQNSYAYTPAGQDTVANPTGTTTPDQFLGQPADSTGLDSLGARYYSPATNRFLSPDPLGTPNQSPYAYAGDNPVNRSDPSGLLPDPPEIIGGCLVGGVLAAGQAALNNPKIGLGGMLGAAGKGCVTGAIVAAVTSIAFEALGPALGWAADLGGDAAAGDLLEGEAAGAIGDAGLADAGDIAAESTGAAGSEPSVGQTVYRVYGGDSAAGGASWSPVDPSTVADFRNLAGLPSGGASAATNTGQFVIEGTLVDPSTVVIQRGALRVDGLDGGLPEYVIPNWLNNGAITIRNVSGANPAF